MKRKILVILVTFVNIFALAGNIFLRLNPKPVEINNCKVKSGMLSMMLETDTNSKTYIQSTSNDWPTDGYMFNEEMSKCEQGSALKWDDTNKKVVMEGNSSDKCYVFFDKYNPIKINNYSITSSGNKITITIDATSGTGTISKYYYSKDDGVTYVESTSNNYVFTSLDKGTYKVNAYVEDSNGKMSEVLSKTIEITSFTLADYVIDKYTGTQGENGLYYHDSSLENGAKDNSYRYAGANPDNYICFGDTYSGCLDEHLYRIIGVFDGKVKLVKWDYATSDQLGTDGDFYKTSTISSTASATYKGNNTSIFSYYYNHNNENIYSTDWRTSLLNVINLNTNFLNSFGSTWSSFITASTWSIPSTKLSSGTPSTILENETSNTISVNTKIGLAYTSDYGFAAGPSAWSKTMAYDTDGYNSTDVTSINWMYMGLNEWTISYNRIYNTGALSSSGSEKVFADAWSVRPSFYLDSSVVYVSGTGAKGDPIRIM